METAKEKFLAKARAVHGSKYDYGKVEYAGSHNHVEIICPIHKSFWQTPALHGNGHGCFYCRNHSHHVFEFLQKLNTERGWNLVGGNQEFAIPSGITAAGKYRFDGCDIQRRIFFEYNEKPHRLPEPKERDAMKKARLKEWLKERGLEGKGTYVVYDQVTDSLSEEAV